MTYDESNIFAKILRGEIPCNKVYEDDHVLAFHDISALAPVHILVIPKGAYMTLEDFSANASDKEITGFYRAVAKITEEQNLSEKGFRAISNSGDHGGQEVPHYHLHLLGGTKLGKILGD